MMQRRSVATAGFAFASHIYQAWNLHSSLYVNSAALFVPLTTPSHHHQQQQQRMIPTTRYFSQYNHQHYLYKGTHIGFGKNYCYNRYYLSQQQQGLSRLFGSKSGSGIPGAILIQDDPKVLLNIDLNRLQQTATEIRKHLASTPSGNEYETYDVSIYLVDDEAMQEANNDSRKINEPTDILSFQFHDAIEPGKLEDPMLDVADYYNLGDILIDVPYVIRCCQCDQRDAEGGGTTTESSLDGTEEDDDDGEWVDDDRGVSGAMSKIFDPEIRINMLLVHGMLHLVGYDHEDDEDYELMVKKEEEILEILQSKGLLNLPINK